MKPVEYDVYLCCPHPDDRGMAADVAAGLANLGFRVFVADGGPAAADEAQRRRVIEKAPDFVLLSSPGGAGPADGRVDSRRADLAYAFKTRRNIVVLADPADADSLVSADLPGYPKLAPWQRVGYDRTRAREAIAVVGHRLVSSSEIEDRRLMRTAKRAFVAAGVILLAAVALKAVPAALRYWNRPQAPPPLPRFTLYWTAFGQRPQNGQWSEFPVSAGAAVIGSGQVRLVFSTGSDGFAYVVVREARGGISVLYPRETIRGASRVKAGAVCEVPGDGRWLQVDTESGPDAIYLLAGHEPLENIEELVEESESDANRAARVELLRSTLAGLLDGRRTAVPPPVRIRGGREIVGSLSPVPPPAGWQATLTGGSIVTHRPAVETGLVSAAVEIRLRPGPF